jgi:hypothetical protein
MSIFTTHIDPEATIVQLKEKSEKLKAERDRLREALVKISETLGTADDMERVARAALEGE